MFQWLSRRSSDITADELRRRLEVGEDICLVDVREPQEWRTGHIDGARHIPLGELPRRLAELNPKAELVLVCRSGNRSGRGCRFLAAQGFKPHNLRGGMLEWTGPVQTGD